MCERVKVWSLNEFELQVSTFSILLVDHAQPINVIKKCGYS